MSFVVDASVVLAWYYEEPHTLPQKAINDIADNGAFVPSLFILECANSFSLGVRQKRLTLSQAEHYFESVLGLGLSIDEEELPEIAEDIFQLSLRHQLTSYDATYLELAKRKKLPLATLDKALRTAAKKEKVAVLA